MASRKPIFVGLIISVAVFAAILITVLGDVDQETVEVTKYEYITSTTSLFDYDDSPQYIEYDMAENYTGYYNSSSDPYWGGVGTQGDGYYTTETVNRYILNIEPSAALHDTLDITGRNYTNVYDDHFTVVFYGPDGTLGRENWPALAGNVRLTDIISDQSLTEYTKITLTPASTGIGDRILFVDQNDIRSYQATSYTMRQAHYTYANTIEDYPTWQMGTPSVTYPTQVGALSCVINYTTGTVNFYSSTNADASTFVKSVELEDVLVIYGGTQYLSYNTFGSSMVIDAVNVPPTQYLDISKGVRVGA